MSADHRSSGTHPPDSSTTTASRRSAADLLSCVLVLSGVLLSAWPLTALFDTPRWIGPALLMMTVVAGLGVVVRALTPSRPLVLIVQTASLLAMAILLFAPATTILWVVPTQATIARFASLITDAAQTISSNPPPAPASPGVVAVLATTLSIVALLGDALAVTLRRPALAGLALLMPLLIAVANSDGSLPVLFFTATATCWLGLLAVHERRQLRSWLPRHSRSDDLGRTGAGIVLGCAGIALALVAAAALPHAPARYLAEGLGRDGVGRGSVGFSPSADLLRDLESTDSSVVLSYHTDDPDPPPLRVSVAELYSQGRWYPLDARQADAATPELPYPDVADDIERRQRTAQVEQSRMKAPYLATAGRLTRMSVTGAHWAATPSTDIVSVDRTPTSYTMTYLDIAPEPDQLRARNADQRGQREPSDGQSRDIEDITARVTASAGTDFDKMVAIQNWLRSSAFTYDLQLAPRPAGMSQEQAAATAVERFLSTKRGYCVQFATAMALMARSVGVRARVVTGFLPGTAHGQRRDVVAADAHMWPEVYFPGAGWVRFEPTPGSRTGGAPAYAAPTAPGAGGATSSPSASASSQAPTTGSTTPPSARRPDVTDAGGAAVDPGAVPSRAGLWLAASLVLASMLLGSALILPLAARRRRGRAMRSVCAKDEPVDAVDMRWHLLVQEARDLGLTVDDAAAVSAQGHRLSLQALLDPDHDAALHRVTDAVQAARYTPDPNLDLASLDADLDAISRALRTSRRPRERMRATLLPSAGKLEVRQWLNRWRLGPSAVTADSIDPADPRPVYRNAAHRHLDQETKPTDTSLFTRP